MYKIILYFQKEHGFIELDEDNYVKFLEHLSDDSDIWHSVYCCDADQEVYINFDKLLYFTVEYNDIGIE